MAHKTFALQKGGHIYTLMNYHGDKIPGCRWKYIGYKDGQRWGAFTSKKEFERAVDMEPDFNQLPPIEERNAKALGEQMYSEMTGNKMLDDLQRALYFQRKAKGQTMFKPISHLRIRTGDRIELQTSPGIVYVVEKLNSLGQPYVKREDGSKIGVNDGVYVWDDLVRILPPIEVSTDEAKDLANVDCEGA